MRKKLLLFILAFALLLICGCDTPNEEVHPYVGLSDEEFIDREKKHKPTDNEILSIKKGMRFYDAIDILGLPHARGTDFASTAAAKDVFLWETVEGNVYEIMFLVKEKQPDKWYEMMMSEYFQYTVVVDKPFKNNKVVIENVE